MREIASGLWPEEPARHGQKQTRVLRAARSEDLACHGLGGPGAGGIGVVARLWLPSFARDYVNRTLDRNPLYSGQIGEIKMHVWRGAYSIRDIRISKTTGNVPVPFFAAKRVDFAVEWKALFHRRLVGRVLISKPEINFVDSSAESDAQAGGKTAWLEMIRSLSPFKINSAVIKDGTIHFRAYQPQTPVDVYISEVEATIDNLGNIRDDTNPLLATVQAKGLVMDHARLDFKMTLDPFSYRPDVSHGHAPARAGCDAG